MYVKDDCFTVSQKKYYMLENGIDAVSLAGNEKWVKTISGLSHLAPR
jgi:hypothetical protein